MKRNREDATLSFLEGRAKNPLFPQNLSSRKRGDDYQDRRTEKTPVGEFVDIPVSSTSEVIAFGTDENARPSWYTELVCDMHFFRGSTHYVVSYSLQLTVGWPSGG